jgi:hypothetical protein
MNAFEIWVECRRRAIKLAADGDRLSYKARDAATVERILPLLRDNKAALLDCVKELQGLPVEDGPFLPWGPYLTPQLLAEWQRELYEAVQEVARFEGWPQAVFDLVVGAIERQPMSTLRPDLAHFKERAANWKKVAPKANTS